MSNRNGPVKLTQSSSSRDRRPTAGWSPVPSLENRWPDPSISHVPSDRKKENQSGIEEVLTHHSTILGKEGSARSEINTASDRIPSYLVSTSP